jgi:hypothetical protein
MTSGCKRGCPNILAYNRSKDRLLLAAHQMLGLAGMDVRAPWPLALERLLPSRCHLVSVPYCAGLPLRRST